MQRMTSANETRPAPPAKHHHPTLRHPAVLAVQRERAQNIQLRIADQITRFAGSIQFVYIHVVLFAVWMLWLEKNPWPTLTLVVSLEAIFLSTFVMIGQNRQADISQRKADHDYRAQELELDHNTKVTELIHQLTLEIHAAVAAKGTADGDSSASGSR